MIRLRIHASLVFLLAAALAGGGAYLLRLGGSSYYCLAGLVLFGASTCLWKADERGAWLYGLVCLATVLWALSEVGLNPWALVPRIALLLLLGLYLVLPSTRRSLRWPSGSALPRPRPIVTMSIIVMATLIVVGIVALGSETSEPERALASMAVAAVANSRPTEWPAYGRDASGNRYSPATQINVQNVKELELAWTFRWGESLSGRSSAEMTPLEVGDRLFFCTPRRQVISIDAETGREIWRFTPGVDTIPAQVAHLCRGVSYHEEAASSDADAASTVCKQRVLSSVRNGELWALDASTGRPCTEFGQHGMVSLLEGLAPTKDHDMINTSPGAIAGDLIILGAHVVDGKSINVPSGVVRAYSVKTGALVWAWDVGRPDRTGAPPPGETYTPSTPNAWAPFSVDLQLQMVYVPTGNPSPDFFGGYRREFDEKYGSSLVALDLKTGQPRWAFQAVHHDLWDLDVPAQPILVDLRTPSGRVPAVVQLTKTGDVFVLDRRTGTPIVPLKEQPFPQGSVAEDRLSPTQPVSAISFTPGKLRDSDMWGLTPLDQMMCRIAFAKARYEGPYTPPGLTTAIGYPASSGTFSWGSGAVDPHRGLLVVNASYMPFLTRLIRHPQDDPTGELGVPPDYGEYSVLEQKGTPYAYYTEPMLGPLRLPCMQPPWGRFMAVDLPSGRVIWQKVLGTARDNGPFGIPSMLPLTIGTPNIGGPMVTAGDLAFIGATTDRYLRAFDIRNGREVWKASLPAAANATPMTYVSAASGRQFVVIAAGGHDGLGTRHGDYLLAFALPHDALPAQK